MEKLKQGKEIKTMNEKYGFYSRLRNEYYKI